jgi:uncharacterized protein (DUF433 family)
MGYSYDWERGEYYPETPRVHVDHERVAHARLMRACALILEDVPEVRDVLERMAEQTFQESVSADWGVADDEIKEAMSLAVDSEPSCLEEAIRDILENYPEALQLTPIWPKSEDEVAELKTRRARDRQERADREADCAAMRAALAKLQGRVA